MMLEAVALRFFALFAEAFRALCGHLFCAVVLVFTVLKWALLVALCLSVVVVRFTRFFIGLEARNAFFFEQVCGFCA